MDDSKGSQYLVVFNDQRRIYLKGVQDFTISDAAPAIWVKFADTYERALIPLKAISYFGPEEQIEERGYA